MGPDATILIFWMLSFKPTFSLFFFTFIKRLFNRPENKNPEARRGHLCIFGKVRILCFDASSHFADTQMDYPHLMDKKIKSLGPHSSEGSEHLIYRPTLSLRVLVSPSRKLSFSRTRPSEGPGHAQPWHPWCHPVPSPHLALITRRHKACLAHRALLRSAATRGRALHTISSWWRRLVLGSGNWAPGVCAASWASLADDNPTSKENDTPVSLTNTDAKFYTKC